MRSLGTHRILRIMGATAGTLRGASAAREEARVGKNILIFSDGTGQAGGYMPDEARSNVYKLFRATRVGPESVIDPELQLAFYDGGLGSRAETIKITPLRRLYNLLSRATGLGITQNIIDCYAHIIRVWQPGDRIYLFGFSRGAYTVRCVGGVLKSCGIPTAVREKGQVRPLQRDARSARRIATEAVKHVYQHGGSITGDPLRLERERRAARFRYKYFSGDAKVSNTAPYFIGVWETVQTLGAGTLGLTILTLIYEAICAGLGLVSSELVGGGFWLPFLLLGVAVPVAIYAAACMRYKGLVSLHRYRQAFYDTRLNHAVRYARHALAIDENRASFACVPWDEEPPRQSFTDQPNAPPRFRQVWFAGSHSDVGGSYPETEARLSDIALVWMVQEVLSLPHPIHIDASVLKLFPDPAGPQHDEREAFMAACPGLLVDMCLRVYDRRKFGWREGHRTIPVDALLHPSVLERLALPGVLDHGDIVPYRPHALREHWAVRHFWEANAAAAGRPRASRAPAIPGRRIEPHWRRARG
jgi:uncharacterized protein (DUF2235 family)